MLFPSTADDAETRGWLNEFQQGLAKLGWSEGRNVHIEVRFGAGKPDRFAGLAKELVALQPDLLVGHSPAGILALKRETTAIPMLFAGVSDPVGGGLVSSLARPGGNITGMLSFEPGIVGKWLAMLKEIAPSLTRVALIANPRTTNYNYFLQAAETAASALAIELVAIRIASASDIEPAVTGFARAPNGGLMFIPDATNTANRDLVIAVAARSGLPAVYPFRYFVAAGGLMSYGNELVAMYRQAAIYADRILRGAKPAQLPVQTPTTYQTVVNLKAAKALGLAVPPSLLVRADEVIE
jgi:putative ABC transport system substrate-binding protein